MPLTPEDLFYSSQYLRRMASLKATGVGCKLRIFGRDSINNRSLKRSITAEARRLSLLDSSLLWLSSKYSMRRQLSLSRPDGDDKDVDVGR